MDRSKQECGSTITNARWSGVNVCALSAGAAGSRAGIRAEVSTAPGRLAALNFGLERPVAQKSTAYSHLYRSDGFTSPDHPKTGLYWTDEEDFGGYV